MATFTSKITAQIIQTLTKTVGLSEAAGSFTESTVTTLTSGTGLNQADKVWSSAARSIAASSNEDLDLAGSLTDAFGTTITFARIKALYVAAAATNTNNVHVGGAASNQFINWVANSSDILVVRPGGVLLLAAPDATAYAVTAATGDLLRVANSGAGSAVIYDVVIIGSSA